jgi:hypothetical protein
MCFVHTYRFALQLFYYASKSFEASIIVISSGTLNYYNGYPYMYNYTIRGRIVTSVLYSIIDRINTGSRFPVLYLTFVSVILLFFSPFLLYKYREVK